MIDKALAKDKDDRYQDIMQMKKDLVNKEPSKGDEAAAGAAAAAATMIAPPPTPPTMMGDRVIEEPEPRPSGLMPSTTPIQEPAPEPLIPPPEPSKKRGWIWLTVALFLAIIAGVVVVISLLTTGGTTMVTWERSFGGEGRDQATSVIQTDDDGYVMAGVTNTFGSGKNDAWIVKTDLEGNQTWSNAYGGEENDAASSVQQTSDGGYILAGWTESEGSGKKDAWLLKTDSDGALSWDKAFGEKNDNQATAVQQTSDGGYIMAGWTQSESPEDRFAWLIKTDDVGELLWSRGYEKRGNNSASSVRQASDGGYVLAGWTRNTDSGTQDAWLLKTDSDGNILWDKTFGGEGTDDAVCLELTSDGGYILAGNTDSQGSGGFDAWLIKTEDDGEYLWSEVYGGADNDRAGSVQQTSYDGYVLAGWTKSSSSGGKDAWLIKADYVGLPAWDSTFGADGDDAASSVQETSDGGYIMAGWTESFGSGKRDAWLVKTDPDGKAAGLEEGKTESGTKEDEDKGEESFEVEEEEETATTPEGDEKVPTDEELGTPLYPGAEYRKMSSWSYDWGQGFTDITASWTTDDDFDTVVAWYTQELGPGEDTPWNGRRHKWEFLDSTGTYEIEIFIIETEGEDMIEIKRGKYVTGDTKREYGLE